MTDKEIKEFIEFTKYQRPVKLGRYTGDFIDKRNNRFTRIVFWYLPVIGYKIILDQPLCNISDEIKEKYKLNL